MLRFAIFLVMILVGTPAGAVVCPSGSNLTMVPICATGTPQGVPCASGYKLLSVTPVCVPSGAALSMTINTPASPNVTTANQVAAPALIPISVTDAISQVAAASIPISVSAPGMLNVEVWTHNALAVRLTASGGNFTGNLNLSAEPAGPIRVDFYAWDALTGNPFTINLQASEYLFVAGTRAAMPNPPAPAAGMIPVFVDRFTSLNAGKCKPGTGRWPGCSANASSDDGFNWYENLFNGNDFGDCANEHTSGLYNPFTILPSGGLRIRNTFDLSYTDPYSFGRHQYCGVLSSGSPDGKTSVPATDGYYDARIFVPDGFCGTAGNNTCSGGTWPSFWMLSTNGGANNIELDMAEEYGTDNTFVQQFTHAYGTAFYPSTPHGGSSSHPGIQTWGWHTVGMLITGSGTSGGQVCDYIDEVQQFCGSMPQLGSPNSAVKPTWSVMLELASGGGWVSNPPPSNQYDYFVDWVGVWATPPAAFYVSPTGNDANAGTLASPFLTLHQCAVAMRGSGTKTCYIRAGSYTPAAQDASICNGTTTCAVGMVSPTDNGETWSYYPPDGAGTADITGGSSSDTTGLFDIFYVGNTTGVTINGLKLHNFQFSAVASSGGNSSLTAINNTISNGFCNGGSGNCAGHANEAAIQCYGCANAVIMHNSIDHMGSFGISFNNVNGDISHLNIAENYLQSICTGLSDCGAIYLQDLNATATDLRVINNYVKDGATFAGLGSNSGSGIYLDDCTSNVTAANNVLTGRNGSNTIHIHGGNNDVFKGNLVDLSTLGQKTMALQTSGGTGCSAGTMSGNQFQNNLVISGGGGGGFNVLSGSPGNAPAISHNDYFKYSGAAISTAGSYSDASPLTSDPMLTCWSYLIDRASPIFMSATAFPGFANSWGPPGFLIPQTGTVPSSPHAC